MTETVDRNTLLETALNNLPDGIAVMDSRGDVVFWSDSAEAITGYARTEFEAGEPPDGLRRLLRPLERKEGPQPATPCRLITGGKAQIRHGQGHEISLIVRCTALEDELGMSVGAMVTFHPAERVDALPHGDNGQDQAATASRQEFEERLRAEFDDFVFGGEPLGMLWFGIDQAPGLRKTHGAAACQSMLDIVRRTLAAGLRPAEELGCWGEDEFLIITHERTPEMLTSRARTLAGLARTADFRWWGDRVSLTVSAGVAQANRAEPLPLLLERARKAAEFSIHEGGNRVSCAAPAQAREEQGCSPS